MPKPFKLTEAMQEVLTYIPEREVRSTVEKVFELAWQLGINEGLEQAKELIKEKLGEQHV